MKIIILAAGKGYTEIVRLLTDVGADVHIKNNNGNTALKLARLFDNTEIIEILEEYGINEVNLNPRTI